MADNIKINLHTHTNISDGELSPNNLLQVANANEVELFSITDHDTIVHQSDIVRSPNKSKKYIKGVEISACWNNNVIHLLHYFQDGKMCGELLKKNHKSYIQRSCYLIEQINLLLNNFSK
ncbi:PHP domain-containing protein [Photorhabdus laumondii]